MFQSLLTAAAAGGSFLVGNRWRTATLGLLLTGAAAFPATAQVSGAATKAALLGTTGTALTVANRVHARPTSRPVSGNTHQARPQVANDMSVGAIYSLGQLPIPFGAPHAASALVINSGTTARPSVAVTLTVSGANTFTNTQTLTNVAPGDSVLVTFAGYTPTTTGSNTLVVSVPADGNTSNDSQMWMQEVTNDSYRYADDGPPSTSYGLNTPGLWLVKYTTTQAKSLISTSVYLGNDPGIIGKRYYGVLTDDQGAIVARTPNYTVTAADTGSYHAFNFATTPSISAGDFYVGFGQVTGATEFPLGVQDEDPTRIESYFVFIPGTGMIDLSGQIPVRPMISATLGAAASCVAPDNLAVSGVTANGGTASYDVVAGAQSYTVFFGPSGFTPNGAGSQSVNSTTGAATLAGLLANTNYDVYVQANCSSTSSSAINGPVSFTTSCVSGTITTFPYTESFENSTPPALPCGTTVVNANNDAETWTPVPAFSRTGDNSLRYSYVAANGADDWFFTPGLELTATQQLRLSFWYRTTDPLYPEGLEVKYGNAPTPAAMTSAAIFSDTNISNDTDYEEGNGVIAAAPGTYYVGFHCISDPDQFRLYLDDISIDRVTGLNDSRLARAVSVFPNPTAGRATVSLTETGATRVSLRVIDNLGRVVYTGTMNDNAAKSIDLGNLSNGLYTLKVTLDDQVVTKSLSVLK